LNETAFQDRMQRNHCWGCGASNPDGLQIKSYWDGDESVCTWQPKDYHSAGPPGVLNGGIIASIIDCHSICTAIADAHHAEGRDIGTEPVIWYATGSLQVSYKRPSPITGPVSLRARITERTERKTVLSCSVVAGGEECAVGEVVAVRVPAEWLDA
jgi:acyl-coenzyme A thioesterase PaaI-like protein